MARRFAADFLMISSDPERNTVQETHTVFHSDRDGVTRLILYRSRNETCASAIAFGSQSGEERKRKCGETLEESKMATRCDSTFSMYNTDNHVSHTQAYTWSFTFLHGHAHVHIHTDAEFIRRMGESNFGRMFCSVDIFNMYFEKVQKFVAIF